SEVNRERFLTVEEVERLIASIERDENRIAAKAIMLPLLTGARRNEITHAKWENLDPMVNKGVSLYVVQGLLGHSHSRYTQRYAHLASETLLDAAESLGDVLLKRRLGG